MTTTETQLFAGCMLLFLVAFGFCCVSIHYRKAYEDLKEFIRLKNEIGEL